MSRTRLIPYAVSAGAVIAAVPVAQLLSVGASPFLAAIMVSAWYGGLGPGLLATGLSAIALNLLLPASYFPGTSWEDASRLGVFVLAALLISSLNARQRRLERALRRKDRQKDELLAVIGHELRNPLSAALNALRVLRLQRRDGAPEAPMHDVLERQARNMGRLIDDLLDVSRIGLGKLHLCRTELDLTAVAARAVETARPLIEAQGHRLEVSPPPAPLAVYGDATRLEQVIVNLLTNAAKYTEPGGHIRLAAERGEGRAVLRVIDNGIGVAPETLPHLFDLYVQAEDGSRGGLGIGLHLVRSLVRLHGGEVAAFSEGPGRGTEVVVSLPTGAPAPDAGGAPASLIAAPPA
jgi:signal transduction histidine kinase